MIVLAENLISKGKQLDQLTLRLLRDGGYRNCVANVMSDLSGRGAT